MSRSPAVSPCSLFAEVSTDLDILHLPGDATTTLKASDVLVFPAGSRRQTQGRWRV